MRKPIIYSTQNEEIITKLEYQRKFSRSRSVRKQNKNENNYDGWHFITMATKDPSLSLVRNWNYSPRGVRLTPGESFNERMRLIFVAVLCRLEVDEASIDSFCNTRASAHPHKGGILLSSTSLFSQQEGKRLNVGMREIKSKRKDQCQFYHYF